jgi:hypothetical protein
MSIVVRCKGNQELCLLLTGLEEEGGVILSSTPSMRSLAIYRKNLDGVGSSIIPCACAVFEYITKRL